MELFKGKALFRRSGNYLVICGVFTPSEDLNSYSANDEMWAVELAVLKSIKKVRKMPSDTFSPEEFLENIGDAQDPVNWENK